MLDLPNSPSLLKQRLLRELYLIEWLLGVINTAWETPALFDTDCDLVEASARLVGLPPHARRDAHAALAAGGEKRANDAAALAPLCEVVGLCHNLLKRLLTKNHECALVVDSLDVSEILLSQFKTPWSPPVTEYFDSLLSPAGALGMKAAASAIETDTKLWKSDLYLLVDQVTVSP